MESQAAAIVRDFLRLRQEDQRQATAARPAVRHIVEIGPNGLDQRIIAREESIPFVDRLARAVAGFEAKGGRMIAFTDAFRQHNKKGQRETVYNWEDWTYSIVALPPGSSSLDPATLSSN